MRLALCLVLAAPHAMVWADLTESAYLTDVPPVLTGSRLLQPLDEAPGAVTVIDRDTIRLSGAREIPDVLRLVPGFQIAHDGAFPIVSYHGFTGKTASSSNRLQVLLDGRSLFSGGASGGVDWSVIGVSLDEVERIEVFRGSNSAAYGANASLGVVNIITRQAAASEGTLASLRRGSRGTDDVTLRHGVGGETLQWRITYDRLGDDGFGPNTFGPKQTLSQTVSPRVIDTLRARLDAQPSPDTELRLQAGSTLGHIGVGQAIPDGVGTGARMDEVASSHVQAQWQQTLPDGEHWSVSAYHSDYRYDDAVAVALPRQLGGNVNFSLARQSITDDLEFLRSQRLAPEIRLSWGANLHNEITRSPFYLATTSGIGTQLGRVFANLEWRAAPQTLVNAGASAERSSLTGSDLAPRLMFNQQLAEGHTLRAGVSTATRIPSVWEVDSNNRVTVGNQLLDWVYRPSGGLAPERVESREVSWLGALSPSTTIDVRAFNEQIRHFITDTASIAPPGTPRQLLNPSGALSTFVNGDRVQNLGIEYQIGWRSEATRLTLSESFVHVTSHLGPSVANSAVLDDRMTRSAPKHQLSALLGHRLASGVEASISFYRIGSVQYLDSTWQSPTYSRADARLAWPFVLGKARSTLAFTLQSFNGAYLDVWNSQKFTQRGLLSLSTEI